MELSFEEMLDVVLEIIGCTTAIVLMNIFIQSPAITGLLERMM